MTRPPPALPRPVDVPGALHLEVRVQGQLALDPGEQMFASARDPEHRSPGQVGGRELGNPEVATHQRRPASAASRRRPASHTVSPSGMASSCRERPGFTPARCSVLPLRHPRSRNPRGVARKPAPASAVATASAPKTCSPSARSTDSLPSAPLRAAVARPARPLPRQPDRRSMSAATYRPARRT